MSGFLPSTVALSGTPVSQETPTTGEVLEYSGSVWTPESLSLGNSSWTVTDWYVDPIAGNDVNSGVIANPVKTIMGGVVTKWGTTSPVLKQNTTIHLVNSQTLNEENIVLKPIMVSGTIFGIVGTPVAVATFTLGTVTAKNRSTPQLLTSTGFTSGSLMPGQLVVNSSDGSSRAFIQSITTGTAILTQPLSQLSIADAATYPPPTPLEVDTWAHNNTVTVYTLPLLNLKELNAQGGDSLNGSVGGNWWIQYVNVPDASGTDGNSVFQIGGVDIIGQLVDSYVGPYLLGGFPGADGIDSTLLIGCWLNGGASLESCMAIGGAINTYGAALAGYGAVDGDCICLDVSSSSGVNFVGMAYISTASSIYGDSVLKLDAINGSTSGYSAYLWGPGAVSVSDNACFENVSGTTWAATLLIKGVITLNGETTATKYTSGTFVDGISITTANLDTFDGLQNPRTGARYCSTA